MIMIGLERTSLDWMMVPWKKYVIVNGLIFSICWILILLIQLIFMTCLIMHLKMRYPFSSECLFSVGEDMLLTTRSKQANYGQGGFGIRLPSISSETRDGNSSNNQNGFPLWIFLCEWWKREASIEASDLSRGNAIPVGLFMLLLAAVRKLLHLLPRIGVVSAVTLLVPFQGNVLERPDIHWLKVIDRSRCDP